MQPNRAWIVALCWLTVVFEGFDIVALGASIPTLLNTAHAGMTALDATFIATLSLVGVGLGAALIGPISDRFGRRVPLMACVLVFSVFTFLFPLMPTVALLALVRFLAGLGLGACMPVALTMMQEAAPSTGKAHSSTLTMTGYHAGAVAAAVVALLAGAHWEWLFYGGGVLGLAMIPIMWAKLPETHRAVLAKPAANAPSAAPVVRGRDLLRKPYLPVTLGLWVAAFMGLLLVYGLNTWLPKLMGEAGYNVSDSLVMLLVLNVGAIAGLLVGGRAADRLGVKKIATIWFLIAAVMLATLSIRMESQLVLNVAVLFTGVFVFSAQVLVYGFVGYLYPSNVVGTGMGLVAGVGRLGAIVGPMATGALVSAGVAYPWGFYFFSAVAVLGAFAVMMIPQARSRKQAAAPARTSGAEA